ncbi:TetR/AcrR family transcriptional regulator [Nocardia jinanensis]|uniref:TetR/AcrR family transcriptional regulator n=1 Tax=Nocardia jinanensis TaxID=382504 RepID=UPI000A8484B9|nr:TetR family transcriptional regulator [Nocardia jinanensis]
MPAPTRYLTPLEASEACVAVYLEHGGPDVAVETLARCAGISRRTFHRYFPTKETAVVPVLRHGLEVLAEVLAAHPPDESFDEALVAAFHASAGGPVLDRTRKLVPILQASPAMRAVLSQSFDDAEAILRRPVAERLGLGVSDIRTTVAVVLVTGLLRRATLDLAESDSTPDCLRDYLAVADIGALMSS